MDTRDLDDALRHEIASIDMEEQFDRLESEDYPDAWMEDFGYDDPDSISESLTSEDEHDSFDDYDYIEEEPEEIIEGVTLNGGALFKEDF